MRAGMASAEKVTYEHIVKEPGYCGGKATIGNTRVRVNNVVFLHKDGKTPDQILEHYPDLTFGQVHAALAYYYDHPQEIEAELAADEDWVKEHERFKAEYLSRRDAGQ
jgi:uncharacterized protein (DUF433 family)